MKLMKNLMMASALILLSGCKVDKFGDMETSTQNEQDMISSVAETKEMETFEKFDPTEQAPEKGEIVNGDNITEYYSSEQLRTIIERTGDNIQISNQFHGKVPKEMEHISTFDLSYHARMSNYDFYRNYMEMFRYLFPEEPIDETCLFYVGPNSKIAIDENGVTIDTVKTVAENFDYLMNGGDEVLYYMYSPHFRIGQESSAPRNIFFSSTSPTGSDLFNFNKGVTEEYFCQKYNRTNTVFLETMMPWYRFTATVHDCQDPHNCENEYRMLDGKTIKLKDAVAFFEEYVNTLPNVGAATMNVRVKNATVKRVEEDVYLITFETTKTYDEIPFATDPGGIYGVEGDPTFEYVLARGSMIRSDDVDSIYGCSRNHVIKNEKTYHKFISFEEAANIIINKLTGQVKFTVEEAEFCYLPQAQVHRFDHIEEYYESVVPVYCLKVYNQNEKVYYRCYLDAVNGTDFQYIRTEH